MPDIEEPEPLSSDEQLSNDDVRNHISYEGIGYCILTYIGEAQILDKELQALWIEAKKILKKIIGKVYKE